MKLSDFLQPKKIVFVDGEPQIIKPSLNGEVVFYNLDEDRLKLINDEIIQKLTEDDTDETLSYKMFGYLINIENDIDLETFLKMVDSPPNNAFALILDEFFDTMQDLFNKAETIGRTKDKSEKLKMIIPEIPKSRQEMKNDLLKELGNLKENTTENKKRRKEIFQQLAELEE